MRSTRSPHRRSCWQLVVRSIGVGLTVVMLALAMAGDVTAGDALPIPFQRGEAAHYTIRYGPIKAGIISLEVDAATDPHAPTWLFTGRAISSKLIRLFYEVDDSIESVVDRHRFIPLQLEIQVDESGEKGHRMVHYDHENGIARYVRKRTYHRKHGPSEEQRDDPLEPGALDIFSGLYRLRTVPLEPGQVYELQVHDNGKNWLSRIEVGKPKMINSGLGKIEAVPLEVQVSLQGKLAADRALRIWLSNDERRVMLRFYAELKFGAIKGVLQAYRRSTEAPLQGRPTPLSVEEEAE